MTSINKLWPFFTFYGGKYRAAPHYPPPKYETIIENFAGSAGYSVRYYERKVILVELDPIIAAMWRYMIGATAFDFSQLPVNVEGSVDDLKVCQEAKWLIGFWLNKGAASPCKTPSAWMRSGIRPNSYWGQAIKDRLVAQAGKIAHWQIIEGDYTKAPNIVATHFIDPPYEGAGRLYRCSKVDYKALGEWSKTRQGQTIVCENEGATWLPFKTFRTIKSTPGKRGKGHSAEAIWLNDAFTPNTSSFPPEGWLPHPEALGWFHNYKEVLTEAQLRARGI